MWVGRYQLKTREEDAVVHQVDLGIVVVAQGMEPFTSHEEEEVTIEGIAQEGGIEAPVVVEEEGIKGMVTQEEVPAVANENNNSK